jgi:hypothetical protein
MTDQDIVTRLRGHIAITLHLNYPKDGYPESVYVHGPSPICQEAADEIERLRAERDEARRMFCKCHAQAEAIGYAEGRGWDCFKEDGK